MNAQEDKPEFGHQIAYPPPGRYVVALSGGVDSVALLDLLASAAEERRLELVVAHFNHGWPGDDGYEQVARQVARRYGLTPVVGQGQAGRSEASARGARYKFLRRVMGERGAAAIITAHHQDDAEETLLLNLLRGTGRQGLAPFRRMPDVLRPLTALRKTELAAYAADRELSWCHDSYNDDLSFRRNAVRRELIPQLAQAVPQFHDELTVMRREAGRLNRQIDGALAELFTLRGRQVNAPLDELRRLDLAVLAELLVAMAGAVRPGAELRQRTVEQLAVDIKTGRLQRRRRLGSGLFATCAHDTVTMVFTP